MIKTLEAVFDGKVLVPEKPANLEINRHYLLIIKPMKENKKIDDVQNDSAFDLSSLAVETGIPDLATEHDHYLYGTPKRSGNDA